MAITLDLERMERVAKYIDRLDMLRFDIEQTMREADALGLDVKITAVRTVTDNGVAMTIYDRIEGDIFTK